MFMYYFRKQSSTFTGATPLIVCHVALKFSITSKTKSHPALTFFIPSPAVHPKTPLELHLLTLLIPTAAAPVAGTCRAVFDQVPGSLNPEGFLFGHSCSESIFWDRAGLLKGRLLYGWAKPSDAGFPLVSHYEVHPIGRIMMYRPPAIVLHIPKSEILAWSKKSYDLLDLRAKGVSGVLFCNGL